MPRRLLPCALGLYLALLPVLLSVLPPALPAGAQGAPGESPAQPTPAPGATAAPRARAPASTASSSMGTSPPAPGGASSGAVFALDERGQAIPNLDPRPLQATLDERPVPVTWAPQRPRMAILVGFLLSPSASEPVRRALALAVKERLAGLDLRSDGDAVAVAGTSNPLPWSQATFTSSADDLALLIDRTLQAPPPEGSASLREVEGGLRALAGQPGQRIRVLLLVTNQPLGGLTTPTGELEAIRSLAEAQRIQVGVLRPPRRSPMGGSPSSSSSARPGGASPTPRGPPRPPTSAPTSASSWPRPSACAASPLPAPEGGPHTLTIAVPGGGARATAPFTAPPRASLPPERLLPWLVLAPPSPRRRGPRPVPPRWAPGVRGTAQGPMNGSPPSCAPRPCPG